MSAFSFFGALASVAAFGISEHIVQSKIKKANDSFPFVSDRQREIERLVSNYEKDFHGNKIIRRYFAERSKIPMQEYYKKIVKEWCEYEGVLYVDYK